MTILEITDYTYLSIMSSILIMIGYMVEIYFIYVNKDSKINHLPVWIIWLLSSLLALVYCGLTQQYYSMVNYGLNFFFCLMTLLLKSYYAFFPISE